MSEANIIEKLEFRIEHLEKQSLILQKQMKEKNHILYKLLYEMGGKELMELQKPEDGKLS